ncbi:aluminum-activated malate transporter 12-like protein [Trifolium pratense]|uniref:Aluminum-activated malate transporter 12-like protein n=1 Tax=Trifolium pratense TaxID=57577 RepID=A0A2K3NV16_TRIPR|nr:aluminum-activated malate transporter 12-like protein [Trifolium pratense]
MVPKVHDGLEMALSRNENWKKRMHVLSERLKRIPCLVWKTTWKVGCDDPRRVIHAFKVGLSLTLVSLLYLLEPLFKGIGQNAICAVMTVVVVFEFTAGAVIRPGKPEQLPGLGQNVWLYNNPGGVTAVAIVDGDRNL